MTKPKYDRCPRCDINYKLDSSEYCDICNEEINLDDDSLYYNFDEEVEQICPICQIVTLEEGDSFCEECIKQAEELDLDPYEDIIELINILGPDSEDIDSEENDFDDDDLSIELMGDEEMEAEMEEEGMLSDEKVEKPKKRGRKKKNA